MLKLLNLIMKLMSIINDQKQRGQSLPPLFIVR